MVVKLYMLRILPNYLIPFSLFFKTVCIIITGPTRIMEMQDQ